MKTNGHNNAKTITMSEETQQSIYEFIGKHRAERGGILGSDPDGVIRHFAADPRARCSAAAYDPDIDEMNRQIKKWKGERILFAGFVHSHPPNYKQLSGADEEYATRILAAFKSLDRLCLPLAMTVPDYGRFEIVPIVAIRNPNNRKTVSFEPAELIIEKKYADMARTNSEAAMQREDKPKAAKNANCADIGEVEAGTLTTWRYYGDFPSAWREPNLRKRGQSINERVEIQERLQELQQSEINRQQASRHFDRVKTALDLPLLDNTRLVIIGNGGAASLIRDCARCGFSEFVLVDPDEISESNIGSQSADPRKVGKAKAETLAQEIRTINPASAVLAMPCKIEEITDQDFEVLMKAPLRYYNNAGVARILGGNPHGHPRQPGQVILLGLTDNFQAQARVHRLSLQYGLPAVCAQEYAQGCGAEITWTVPGAFEFDAEKGLLTIKRANGDRVFTKEK